MDLFEFTRRIEEGAAPYDPGRIAKNLFAPEMRTYREDAARTRLPSAGFEDTYTRLFRPIAARASRTESQVSQLGESLHRYALHTTLSFAAHSIVRRNALRLGAETLLVVGDPPASDLAALALNIPWQTPIRWYPEEQQTIAAKSREIRALLIANRDGFYRHIETLSAEDLVRAAERGMPWAGIIIRYPSKRRCYEEKIEKAYEELRRLELCLTAFGTCLIIGRPKLSERWEKAAEQAGFAHRFQRELSGTTVLLARRDVLPCELAEFYSERIAPVDSISPETLTGS